MSALELFSLFQSTGVKGWKVVLWNFQRPQFSLHLRQELPVGIQDHAAVDLLPEDGLRWGQLRGAPRRLRLVGVEVPVQAADDIGQHPASIGDGAELVQQRAGGQLQVALLIVHPSEMWEEGPQVCGDARHPLRLLQAGDVGVRNAALRLLTEQLGLFFQRLFLQDKQIKDD